MPIYEYQCMNCGHEFDVMQKFSDEPIKTCPQCSRDEVKKLVSAAGFHLKGTGWYVTDFRDNDKPKNQSKSESKTSPQSSSSNKEQNSGNQGAASKTSNQNKSVKKGENT